MTLDEKIEKMSEEKREVLAALAAEEGMTLKEYLIDLYEWGEENVPKKNVIVVWNSTTGDIIQNSK